MSSNNQIEKTVSYTVQMMQYTFIKLNLCLLEYTSALFFSLSPVSSGCSFNFIRRFYSCRLLHMHGVIPNSVCVTNQAHISTAAAGSVIPLPYRRTCIIYWRLAKSALQVFFSLSKFYPLCKWRKLIFLALPSVHDQSLLHPTQRKIYSRKRKGSSFCDQRHERDAISISISKLAPYLVFLSCCIPIYHPR
jgi:hypothetical protein